MLDINGVSIHNSVYGSGQFPYKNPVFKGCLIERFKNFPVFKKRACVRIYALKEPYSEGFFRNK